MPGRHVLAIGCAAAISILAVPAAPIQGAERYGSDYRPATLAHCLTSHGASAGVISFKHPAPAYRGLVPPGLTSSVVVMPASLVDPQIDSGSLYVFRSDALAREGVGKLISSFVLLKGGPPILRAMSPTPPSPAAARKLTRIDANVVLIWNYPRRHVAASDEVVNACLGG